MEMKIPRALLGGAAFALTGTAGRADIQPVRIEVPRYMGTWRVIGCMENPLDSRFADATESYSLTNENRLNVVFSWRERSLSAPRKSHEFSGRILKDPSHAVWKMNVFPLVTATYIVIDVGKGYSWAAVAHPSRKFGWILARATSLPDETWIPILSRFAVLGYDTSKFIRVPQPETPGHPGV
jgi:apolipoprotein D and lipocalin family protein